MWEEGVRVALRCMTETPFTGHVGDHVRMPPRNVVPSQCSGRIRRYGSRAAAARRSTSAAQHGIGALSFAFFDPEEAQAWVDDYYTTLAAEGVPIGDAVNANIACVTSSSVTPTKPKRCDAAPKASTSSATPSVTTTCSAATSRHRRPVGRILGTARRAWLRPRSRRIRGGQPRPARRQSGRSRNNRASRRGGHPGQVRDYLRRYEDCGVDQMILSCSAGHNRHEHIMENPRAVRPRSDARVRRTRRAATSETRHARLEPVIDTVMARKPRRRPPTARPRLRDPRVPSPRRRPTGEREVPPLARRLRRQGRRPAKTSANGCDELPSSVRVDAKLRTCHRTSHRIGGREPGECLPPPDGAPRVQASRRTRS